VVIVVLDGSNECRHRHLCAAAHLDQRQRGDATHRDFVVIELRGENAGSRSPVLDQCTKDVAAHVRAFVRAQGEKRGNGSGRVRRL